MRNLTLRITLQVADDVITLPQTFDWVRYGIDTVAGRDIICTTMVNVTPDPGDEKRMADGTHHAYLTPTKAQTSRIQAGFRKESQC